MSGRLSGAFYWASSITGGLCVGYGLLWAWFAYVIIRDGETSDPWMYVRIPLEWLVAGTTIYLVARVVRRRLPDPRR